MRTPITLLLLTAIACKVEVGSGTSATDTRNLEPTTSLAVADGFDVHVQLGDLNVATVTCDDNLLDLIYVGVRGDTLEVGLKPNVSISPQTDCLIDLKVTTLPSQIEFSGSGEVVIEDPASVERIDMSGSGEILLSEGNSACDLEVNFSGSGKIDFGTLSGCGAVISTSGSGTITGKGELDEIEIAMSGSGEVALQDLSTKAADIALSGSGEISLWVTETVVINTSGSGDIMIYGQPEQQTVNSSGSGNVRFE